MPKADLSNTTFSRDPRAGIEVADVYASEALSDFIKSPDLGAPGNLSTLLPDVPADEALNIVTNKSTQEFLNEQGVDVSTGLKQIKDKTPRNIDFSKAIVKHGPKKLNDVFSVMSETLPANHLTSLTNESLNYVVEGWDTYIERGVDVYDEFKKWESASKLDYLDQFSKFEATKDIYNFGVVAHGATKGDYQGLSGWLLEVSDDNVGNDLLDKMLTAAVVSGVVYGVKLIVDKINERKKLKSYLAKLTVKRLLSNYKLDLGLTIEARNAEAKAFVDQLYTLDSGWQEAKRGNETLPSFHNYVYANGSALNIMLWDDRTRLMAGVYKDLRLSAKSLNGFVKLQYPFVI